jgi:hypothetical protein
MCRVKLGRDTKRIQNIAQGYDALQLVYVGVANNGKEFDLGRAHALKCQIKRLILVDVRKMACIHELTQPLDSSTICKLVFECDQADNTYHSSLVGYWPCSERP